jgi:hypothetical protein
MSSSSAPSSSIQGRVFLLSPANCGGARARLALSATARFDLARRLRDGDGVALGELFAFVSGLYFRGKLAYARRFAVSPRSPADEPVPAIHVITPNAGLRCPDTLVTADAVRAFAETQVDARNAAYRTPLETSAARLAGDIGDSDVVLLGSIASPKYVDVLLAIFGERLRFPVEFVGRGDMSRGGLLLRHVDAGVELDYAPIAGAVLRGSRPPKLPPIARSARGTTREDGPS